MPATLRRPPRRVTGREAPTGARRLWPEYNPPMALTPTFVSAAGLRLRVARQGTGRPLLLDHGDRREPRHVGAVRAAASPIASSSRSTRPAAGSRSGRGGRSGCGPSPASCASCWTRSRWSGSTCSATRSAARSPRSSRGAHPTASGGSSCARRVPASAGSRRKPMAALMLATPARYYHPRLLAYAVPRIAGGRTARDPSVLARARGRASRAAARPARLRLPAVRRRGVVEPAVAASHPAAHARSWPVTTTRACPSPTRACSRRASRTRALHVVRGGGHLFLLDEPEHAIPPILALPRRASVTRSQRGRAISASALDDLGSDVRESGASTDPGEVIDLTKVSEPAQAALDVLLTDAAADGGRSRFVRPGVAVSVAAGLAAAAGPRGAARRAPGRRARARGARALGGPAGQARSPLRRSGVAVELAPAPGPADPPRRGRDGRRADHRRRPRLAPRAPGAVRRRQRARRARPEQLPVVEPDGHQGERGRGRDEPRARRAPLPARLPGPARDRRHEQVRGRREPRADAGRGRAAHRGASSSSSTRRRPRRSARCPLLFAPPTINKFYVLDLAPGRSMVEWLVQQGQQVFVISWRNPDVEQGHFDLDTYAAGGARGARRGGRRSRGQTAVHLNGACSGGIIGAGAVGHLAAEGRLGEIASLSLFVAALDNERAGTRGGARQPRGRRGGGRRLRPPRLPRRSRARGRLHVAAAERPGVELRRQQLPARQGAAGLRRAVLEPRHRAARGRPAPRLRPARPRELHRPARRRSRCSAARSTSAPSSSTATSSPGSRTTSSRGRTRTAARSCSAASRASCCPRAATSRRWSTRPAPDSRSSFRVAETYPPSPTRGSSTRPRVPGSWWPDYDQWLAARSGELKPAPGRLGNARHKAQAKAPGSYVHAA